MKPEKKAAIKAAGATALLGGTIAATMTTPVAWAAVLYGAYKLGRAAYNATKDKQGLSPRDEDLFI